MKIVSINHRSTPSTPLNLHTLVIETDGGVRLSIMEMGILTIHADPIGRDFIGRIEADEVSVNHSQLRVIGLRGKRA